MTSFAIDPANGGLCSLATLEYTLPVGEGGKGTDGVTQYGSEIEVVDGRFVYASNRGDGAIMTFKVNNEDEAKPLEQVRSIYTGHVTSLSLLRTCYLLQIASVSTGGTWPRHFAVVGSFCGSGGGHFLVVADQKTSKAVVFSVDKETGGLKKVNEIECGENPSMLLLI